MPITTHNETLFNLAAWGYDQLTDQSFWKAHIRSLADFVPEGADPVRVLDVGCGPGVSTFILAELLGDRASLVGVDLAARMVERAERHHRTNYPHLSNLSFRRADATKLPFDDGAFDLVTGHSFLYLIPEKARVLEEVLRVLRPGGKLVLMEPAEDATLLGAGACALPRWREVFERPLDASRFALSMVLWRVASGQAGRMHPPLVAELFGEAGFSEIDTHANLGGLGLHCVGTKPS